MTPFEIGILSLVFFFSLEHKFLRVIRINFKKQFFDFLLKEVSKVLWKESYQNQEILRVDRTSVISGSVRMLSDSTRIS